MKAHVTVVGAGWAGLSCALELNRLGHPVTLLESARQAGGRARSLPAPHQHLDNGQHLLLGAYREVLRQMQDLGVKVDEALLRMPLQLWQFDEQGRYGFAASAWLPAPLHLLIPLLGFKGLSLGQRYRLIRFMVWCRLRGFRLPQDRSLLALLQQHQQDPRTIELMWEPLCLAALNTPIAEASAQSFLNTLRDSVASNKASSDMLIPRQPLAEIFVEPALRALQQRGVTVRLSTRVSAVQIEAGRVKQLQLESGEQLPVEQLVLATPATISQRLLAPYPELEPLCRQLQALKHYPVCTVYLDYPPEARLPAPMVGLLNGPGQWLFDLASIGQPGRMSMSISGPGEHLQMDQHSLAAAVQAHIARLFPDLPAANGHFVICEKRATFAPGVGIQTQRPPHHTAIANLWLGADYVLHDYPATLEGAVQIGVQCARQIDQQSE